MSESEQALLQAVAAWRDSDECKRMEEIYRIHEAAERIYQQALAAMYPVRIYTTDSTRADHDAQV